MARRWFSKIFFSTKKEQRRKFRPLASAEDIGIKRHTREMLQGLQAVVRATADEVVAMLRALQKQAGILEVEVDDLLASMAKTRDFIQKMGHKLGKIKGNIFSVRERFEAGYVAHGRIPKEDWPYIEKASTALIRLHTIAFNVAAIEQDIQSIVSRDWVIRGVERECYKQLRTAKRKLSKIPLDQQAVAGALNLFFYRAHSLSKEIAAAGCLQFSRHDLTTAIEETDALLTELETEDPLEHTIYLSDGNVHWTGGPYKKILESLHRDLHRINDNILLGKLEKSRHQLQYDVSTFNGALAQYRATLKKYYVLLAAPHEQKTIDRAPTKKLAAKAV